MGSSDNGDFPSEINHYLPKAFFVSVVFCPLDRVFSERLSRKLIRRTLLVKWHFRYRSSGSTHSPCLRITRNQTRINDFKFLLNERGETQVTRPWIGLSGTLKIASLIEFHQGCGSRRSLYCRFTVSGVFICCFQIVVFIVSIMPLLIRCRIIVCFHLC